MAAWTDEEISLIGGAEELQVRYAATAPCVPT
jgi:hypothetical protein